MLNFGKIEAELIQEPLVNNVQRPFGARIMIPDFGDIAILRKNVSQEFIEFVRSSVVVDVVFDTAQRASDVVLRSKRRLVEAPDIIMPFHMDVLQYRFLNHLYPNDWFNGICGMYQMPVNKGRSATTLFARPEDVVSAIESSVSFAFDPAAIVYKLMCTKRLSDTQKANAWAELERGFGGGKSYDKHAEMIILYLNTRMLTISWSERDSSMNGRYVFFDNGNIGAVDRPILHTRGGKIIHSDPCVFSETVYRF